MQLPSAYGGWVLVGGPLDIAFRLGLLPFQAHAFVTLHIEHRQSCRPISLVGCVDVVQFSPCLTDQGKLLHEGTKIKHAVQAFSGKACASGHFAALCLVRL